MSENRRYIIVTPCRNEADYARRTLESVCKQTVPPAEWIIVDDGSTDATPDLLAEYAERYPFVRIVRREDRGARAVGPGVIEAFYSGYDTIDPDADYAYLCKLDLDLDLPLDYFEGLMRRMEDDRRIGSLSGKAWFTDPLTGRLVSEKIGDEMSVGAAKFYQRACFEQIGGFVREVMWDGIDCHRARMLGWKAGSLNDDELAFEHLRPMGSSQKSWTTGRLRHGFGQYFMGTGLPYMTVSAVYRMSRPPIILGGLCMWWGFVRSMLRGTKRYNDPVFRKHVRAYQWACLRHGKAEATRRHDEASAEVWNPTAHLAAVPAGGAS